MSTKTNSLTMHVDDDLLDRLRRRQAELARQTGIEVSRADLMRAALVRYLATEEGVQS